VGGEAGGTVGIGASIVGAVPAVVSSSRWHWMRSSKQWDVDGSCVLAELVEVPGAIVVVGQMGV